MELRDRLSRLGYFTASKPADVTAPPPTRSNARDVPDLLDGTHRNGCFVAESRYALDHVHAGVALSDLLSSWGNAFALLGGDERLAGVAPERVALLDCETTGLAGGTGTYAFLIGVGRFAEGRFCVDQFFMRDPSEERAALTALSETLSGVEWLITFNGKCFDWPLLDTRHTYARVPLTPAFPAHLDLLFPARRLFKRRVGACNLGALEGSVLGLPPRQGDVPGWLIPQIYFDYLRKRDGRPLLPVFEHNRADILAMVALAVRMARHASDPFESALDHASDLFCLGTIYEDRGHVETALRCYERAAGSGEPDVLDRLARAYKRLRDAERAVVIWESMVADGATSIYPYVELAKFLEHKAKDPTRAAELTERALHRHAAARSHTPRARWHQELGELERRLARLERKLRRSRAA